MVRTWRKELGLASEKQSTTTSDLQVEGGDKNVFISFTYNLAEFTGEM